MTAQANPESSAQVPQAINRALEPVLTIAFALGLFIIGSAILFGTTGQWPADPVMAVLVAATVLGWKVPIWIALVAWIAAAGSRRSPSARAFLTLVAAIVAGILELVIHYGPTLLLSGGGLLFGIFLWAPGVLAFTACAAIGAFATIAVLRRPGGAASALAIGASVVLAVGGALALALVSQFFEVYFTLWSTAVVTEADGTRYLWTAGLAVALLALGTLTAALRRLAHLAVLGGILLGLALALAFLFQVPQGRWIPLQEEPAPYNSNYVPCFGEGDPNCIGG